VPALAAAISLTKDAARLARREPRSFEGGGPLLRRTQRGGGLSLRQCRKLGGVFRAFCPVGATQ